MRVLKQKKAILVLENGAYFRGWHVGNESVSIGEVVFNTANTGYQEVLTDPSYQGQIITFTSPHIGNTGINDEDNESDDIYAAGIIAKDIPNDYSNWRGKTSLKDFLLKRNVGALVGVDTRRLVKSICHLGSIMGCIVPDTISHETALAMIQEKKNTFSPAIKNSQQTLLPKQGEFTYTLVVYDFGVKKSILSMLLERKCKIILVPKETSWKEIEALSPDGVVLSNGPGNPSDYIESIVQIKELMKTNIPMLGICLGHQLLALANGMEVIKMQYGHHGINHPVENKQNNKIYITSQNHNYVIRDNSIPNTVYVTHRSLFDNTIQGIAWLNKPIMSFQGHPEGGPGPVDVSDDMFDKFIRLVAHSKVTTNVCV